MHYIRGTGHDILDFCERELVTLCGGGVEKKMVITLPASILKQSYARPLVSNFGRSNPKTGHMPHFESTNLSAQNPFSWKKWVFQQNAELAR